MRNYPFLTNYVTSEKERNFSHIVLYYHQLSIARYQVSFYANNYCEQIPIVSMPLIWSRLNFFLTSLIQHHSSIFFLVILITTGYVTHCHINHCSSCMSDDNGLVEVAFGWAVTTWYTSTSRRDTIRVLCFSSGRWVAYQGSPSGWSACVQSWGRFPSCRARMD